ncbi:unnamed protein product, partial [Brachionus calyciflorus]
MNLVNKQLVSIDLLFSFLTLRRSKYYGNLATNAFSFFKNSENKEFFYELLKLVGNDYLSEKNLPNLLIKIFSQFDPSKLGHQAFNIINDIKKYKKEIEFMKYDSNDELQILCDSIILSSDHINCSLFFSNQINSTSSNGITTESDPLIIPETQASNNPLESSNLNNFTPNDPVHSLIKSFLTEFNNTINKNNEAINNRDKALLDKMTEMLNDHKKMTTPTEIKDKHYS